MMDALRKKVFSSMISGGTKLIRKLATLNNSAVQVNRELLSDILKKNAGTEFGAAHGFGEIHTPEEYRERVRVSKYEDYKPYFARMMEKGEKNLLFASDVAHYFVTSGTTGVEKYIPITNETLKLMSSFATFYSFGLIAQELGDIWTDGALFVLTKVRLGKSAHGTPISNVSARDMSSLGPAYRAMMNIAPDEAVFASGNYDTRYINARAVLSCPDISEFNSSYVSWQLEFMRYIEDNWEMLVRDIEKGVIDPSVELPEGVRTSLLQKIQPNGNRAAFLRREFEKGFQEPIIPRIWPKFACLTAACGGGFARYFDQYKRYLGDGANIYCYGYTASEGVFSVPFALNSTESVLLPQSVFFEFVPEDQADLEHTLFMEDLEVGGRYRVIVTTPSGLYRYDMADIIEVKGFIGECPRIEFLHRVDMTLGMFGEHVTGTEIENLFTNTFGELDAELVDYSAYTEILEGGKGRYVLMAELRGQAALPNDETIKARLWQKFRQNNEAVDRLAARGTLLPPRFCRLRNGTYEAYREMIRIKKGSANQMKPPHILKDEAQINFFKQHIEA